MKKVTQSTEEIQIKTDAATIKRKRREANKKYNYLKIADDSMFRYNFLRGQAEEICEYRLELKLSPFKGLLKKYTEMITEKKFMEDFYIEVDEYQEPHPDFVRLSEALPIKIVLNK